MTTYQVIYLILIAPISAVCLLALGMMLLGAYAMWSHK